MDKTSNTKKYIAYKEFQTDLYWKQQMVYSFTKYIPKALNVPTSVFSRVPRNISNKSPQSQNNSHQNIWREKPLRFYFYFFFQKQPRNKNNSYHNGVKSFFFFISDLFLLPLWVLTLWRTLWPPVQRRDHQNPLKQAWRLYSQLITSVSQSDRSSRMRKNRCVNTINTKSVYLNMDMSML